MKVSARERAQLDQIDRLCERMLRLSGTISVLERLVVSMACAVPRELLPEDERAALDALLGEP